MKKNAMLKIAAILMVAVLLTTCAISSTFAKYVSNIDTATTSATVAKWGITMTSETPTLFKSKYTSSSDSKTMALAANGTDLILAPGTANDGNSAFKFTIKGTPEVAFKLSATIDVNLTGWELDSKFYCPVIVKVNGDAVTVGADAATYAENIEDAIAKAIFGENVTDSTDTKYENTYYPDDKDSEGNKVEPFKGEGKQVYVTWEWPYSTSAENDEKDSDLGDAATAKISFSYDFTAEQIGANFAK